MSSKIELYQSNTTEQDINYINFTSNELYSKNKNHFSSASSKRELLFLAAASLEDTAVEEGEEDD